MGFWDSLQKLGSSILNPFRTNRKRLSEGKSEETRLVEYNTSLVFVPKYKDLSEEEKRRVEEFKEEIRREQENESEQDEIDERSASKQVEVINNDEVIKQEAIESEESSISDTGKLNTYGSELTIKGNENTDLINKFLYKSEISLREEQVEKMSLEEMAKQRLEILTKQGEMEAAQNEVGKLREEAVLRVVAIEEIEKEENKITVKVRSLFRAFQKAEQMKRKNELQMLEKAKERMKGAIKVLEFQSQALEVAMIGDNKLIEAVEIHQKVLEKLEPEEYQKMLEYRKNAILNMLAVQQKMCFMVLPKEAERITELKEDLEKFTEESEARIIATSADIKRKIDIYAMKNQDKVAELKNAMDRIQEEFIELQRVTPIPFAKGVPKYDHIELRYEKEKREKNEESYRKKEELLERMKEIELGCQIFQDFMKEETWEEFYEIKFNLVTFLMTTVKAEYPFSQIQNKERYIAIVERKLEKLFKEQSRYPNLYNKFISLIKEYLKDGKNDMAYNALMDSVFLRFLVDIENPNFMNQEFPNEPEWERHVRGGMEFVDFHDWFGYRYIRGSDNQLFECYFKYDMTIKEFCEIAQFLSENQNPLEIAREMGKFKAHIKGRHIKEIYLKLLYAALTKEVLIEKREGEFVFPSGFSNISLMSKKEYKEDSKTFSETAIKVDTRELENASYIKMNTVTNINKLSKRYPKIMKINIEKKGILISVPEKSWVISKNMNLFTHIDAEEVTTIVVEEGVEEITGFEKAKNLVNVFLPTTLKWIEMCAFSKTSIEKIDLPEGLEIIGYCAFEGTSLKEIKLPSTLKEISSVAFGYCHDLKRVELARGIQKIKSSVFLDCKNLEEIKLPETLEEVGDNIFGERRTYVGNGRIYIGEGRTKIKRVILDGFGMKPEVFKKLYQMVSNSSQEFQEIVVETSENKENEKSIISFSTKRKIVLNGGDKEEFEMKSPEEMWNEIQSVCRKKKEVEME